MDERASRWQRWGREAESWQRTVAQAQFEQSTEKSRDVFLRGLSEASNVIVLVAHCDGESLFMPDPPPAGTVIKSDDLMAYRDQIRENRPFVYLFSCEAADLKNMRNFAGTLLDCGACGVVASQNVIGSAAGRSFLGRLLDDERGEPPVQDLWRAMQQNDFFEMEVFLG